MVKTWAVILNGLVINVVLATDEDFKDPQYVWVDITGTHYGMNWTYDGTNFTMPSYMVAQNNE